MIQLLAVVEASTVTGPAKNLLEFCRTGRHPADGNEGVEVSLVTFHRGSVSARGGEAENEFVAAARKSGIFIAVLPEAKRFDRSVIEGVRAVAKTRKPDIVQSHSVKGHAVMRASGLWREHPWVAWHHAYTATDAKMHLYNQIDRWSLRVPQLVMTVNKPFVRDLERIGVPSKRIRVLHNQARIGWNAHVLPQAIEDLKNRLDIDKGEKIVLAVGRFSLEKGHIDLIHAFADLCAKNPAMKVRLVLVGEGPERGNLENAAKKLGVAKKIVFAGQISDVGPYFALADAMALPSHGEGSPNVLLEAMAAGLPTVSTTVGGIPEIVQHEKSALLLEARDVGALTREMERILKDENLARSIAENALEEAKKYAPEVRLQALLEIYRGIARHDKK
jgi:glycosyltransferase involved in cell wall biosynthesis